MPRFKQNAYDFLINWLDTAQIDRRGELVKFDKTKHKIYFANDSKSIDQINIKYCNYIKPGFITIDSLSEVIIKANGIFKPDINTEVIELRRNYITKSTHDDFTRTHLSGDIYVVMGGSIILGRHAYVHIYIGFGDWIQHDLVIKIDENGTIEDYVLLTTTS